MMRSMKGWMAAMMVVAVLTTGCAGTKEKESTGPAYGIVEMDKAIESHPKYSEYNRLKKEYDVMTASYRAEQMLLSKKAAAQEQQVESLDSQQGITAELNRELAARMQMKENELNRQLQATYTTLVNKHQLEHRFDQAIDASSLAIVNMELKLKTAHLKEQERQQLEQELVEALKNRKGDYLSISQSLVEEVAKEMVPYKQEAEKELAAYRETVLAELSKERATKMQQMAEQIKANDQLPDPKKWNEEWKEKLEAKKKEADTVHELILADIKRKAETVGEKKQLDMIFSSYEVNVKAVDVTDDIIASYGQ